jgi:hypothetical protein
VELAWVVELAPAGRVVAAPIGSVVAVVSEPQLPIRTAATSRTTGCGEMRIFEGYRYRLPLIQALATRALVSPVAAAVRLHSLSAVGRFVLG